MKKNISTGHLIIFVGLASLLSMWSCATGQTRVWTGGEIPALENSTIELQPVFNASRNQVPEQFTHQLTLLLAKEFERRNLTITSPAHQDKSAVVLRSRIVFSQGCQHMQGTNFAGPSNLAPANRHGTGMIKSELTLLTRITDKATDQIVAEVTVTKTVGACTHEPGGANWLLQEVAKATAKEVTGLLVSD